MIITHNERLRDYFKSKNITQDEVAADLKVSQTYVSSILRGQTGVGVRAAKKFADKYNLSVEWILTGKEIDTNNNEPELASLRASVAEKDLLITSLQDQITLQKDMITMLKKELARVEQGKLKETPVKE